MLTPLLVALGAAVGAPLRYWPRSSSTGTDGRALALLGVGFCGAFTTYSTFAVQTLGLGPRRGSLYALATLVGSLAGCALGYLVGTQA